MSEEHSQEEIPEGSEQTKTSPSEALYAFMNWLNSRKIPSGPFSAETQNTMTSSMLVEQFCQLQGWDVPRDGWMDHIVDFQKEEQQSKVIAPLQQAAVEHLDATWGKGNKISLGPKVCIICSGTQWVVPNNLFHLIGDRGMTVSTFLVLCNSCGHVEIFSAAPVLKRLQEKQAILAEQKKKKDQEDNT